MWNRLMNWLLFRDGKMTWFGRWYFGYEIGPLPRLIDDDDLL